MSAMRKIPSTTNHTFIENLIFNCPVSTKDSRMFNDQYRHCATNHPRCTPRGKSFL